MEDRSMAIRSNWDRFRLKRLTFFRWEERTWRFITPIIYIRCYFSSKKIKGPTFSTIFLRATPYTLLADYPASGPTSYV